MALRTTFETVIEMTREEARLSTNTSRGTDHLAHIQRVIKRHYETLAEKWDWQHLNLRGDAASVDIEAGSRYYDFPETVNINKITGVMHKWSGQWTPLGFGIDNEHYSIHDSEEGVRADPIAQWDFKDHQQFEVWPLPASASGPVRFEGQKKVEALTEKSSRLDLDDVLISLYAAAEILAENDRKVAAGTKAAAAADRLAMCKGFLSDKARYVVGMGGHTGLGNSRSPRLYPRHPTHIR